MNKLTKLLFMFLATIAGLGIFVPLATVAQTPTEIDTTVLNPLPSIFIYNLAVNKIENSAVSGFFQISNESTNAFGDLKYTISLIDKDLNKTGTFGPEAYSVYDKKVFPVTTLISAGEKKVINFSYTAPETIPLGDYRLRVRVGTNSGYELGWDNTKVTLGTDNGYINIFPRAIKATGGVLVDGILNEKGEAEPLDGINTDPGKEISFFYSLNKIGKKEVNGVLSLSTYEWDDSGKVITTEKVQDISFKTGAINSTKDNVFTTTTQIKPGSYYVTLSAVDTTGRKISSIGEYRYVVKGKSARIVSASLKDKNSNQVAVSVEVVGPADRVTVIENARLKFYLLSDEKVISEETSNPIKLDTSSVITVTNTLPLNGATKNLSLKADLIEQDGNILHSYGYKIGGIASDVKETPANTTKTEKNINKSGIWVAILEIILAFCAIGLLVFVLLRNKKSKNQTPTNIIALLLLVTGTASALSGITNYARAQGQVINYIPERAQGTQHSVRLFVNKPIKNSTFTPGSQVPVEVYLYVGHCNNRWTNGWFYMDYFSEGGHIVPKGDAKTVPGGQREWVPPPADKDLANTEFLPSNLPASRWTKLIDYQTKPVKNCPGGGKYCTLQNTYTGFISLPSSMSEATLRFLGFKRHFASVSAPKWNESFLTNIAGYYSWISIAPLTPPLSCGIISPATSAGTPVTLTAIGGDPNQTYRWSSSNAADVFSPVTGTTTTLTPQAGSHTIKVMNGAYLDVDGNGTVTMNDYNLVVNYTNGGRTPVPTTGMLGQNQTNPLNVDGDALGVVNSSDAIMFNETNTANYIIPVATCGPNFEIAQPQPQIKVTVGGIEQNPIQFGNVTKETTVTKTVTITNVGHPNSVLQVNYNSTSISPVNAFSAVFPPNTVSIPQGGTSTFDLTFSPSTATNYESTLSVASNDSNTANGVIGLRGTGTEPPVQVISGANLWFSEIRGVAQSTKPTTANIIKGETVKLGWSSTNATTCSNTFNTSDTRNTGTSTLLTPNTGVTTYSLTCSSPGSIPGSNNATITVQNSGSGTNIRDL